MNNTISLVLYFVVFFGIMYFLMIRPQQKQAKQRQALLSSLRVKDKVLTAGGIYGKITKVKEKSVIVQIADKVEIEVAKSGITSVENREVVVEKDNKGDKNDKKAKDKANNAKDNANNAKDNANNAKEEEQAPQEAAVEAEPQKEAE